MLNENPKDYDVLEEILTLINDEKDLDVLLESENG